MVELGSPRVSDILSELSRKASVQSSVALLLVGVVAPAAADSSRPTDSDGGHAASPTDCCGALRIAGVAVPDVLAAPANGILYW